MKESAEVVSNMIIKLVSQQVGIIHGIGQKKKGVGLDSPNPGNKGIRPELKDSSPAIMAVFRIPSV